MTEPTSSHKDAPSHLFKGERCPDGARPPLDGRIVRLDVGGRRFKTYASTLRACPDGMLARMLDSGFNAPETHDGCLFVDRDPQYFAHILAYLRCVAGGGTSSLSLPDNADALEAIADEADYFGLTSLSDDIRGRLAARKHEAQKAAKERAAPPLPLPPNHASLRILIARGGQRAALSAQGAKPWDDRHDRIPLAGDIVFRQRTEWCDRHKHGSSDFWDREYHMSCDGASCAVRTKKDVAEVVACQACSAIDTAALVDAAVDAMTTAKYTLCSIKQFPKVADAKQSLTVYLAFERVHDKSAHAAQRGLANAGQRLAERLKIAD
ncbi:BTB/POZ domain protein [Pandoravirus inopinatum]|uniref:BTB/POZ domain protein n=1 Tax=Pandoravirus inopinatum TaxID=1605721 RepID=A0A0B5JA92_9VIRU|nr:BTB/POZ domain protein [Pandoravirus inopinatum]AJF97821.1 BTB/POZ domain protein [Pandoravirus inopinatum]